MSDAFESVDEPPGSGDSEVRESQVPAAQRALLRPAFDGLANAEGEISFAQLLQLVHEIDLPCLKGVARLPESVLLEISQTCDIDQSGMTDWEELMAIIESVVAQPPPSPPSQSAAAGPIST